MSQRRSGQIQRLSNHLIGISPLVVVPAHDFHEILVDYLRQAQIDDRSVGLLNMSEDTIGSSVTARTWR